MTRQLLPSFLLAVIATGCVSYAAVGPGAIDYGGLTIQTSQSWNLAPKEATPAARPSSKTWTKDGLLLDRIMIIPGVPSGEPLFVAASGEEALPVFRADMLPNEIEELTESSLVKLFSEGNVAVETRNLRPNRFGDTNGVLFDIDIAVSDGPNYKGMAGAFVSAERLNVILFIGADPFYYERHVDEAMVIIKGARV